MSDSHHHDHPTRLLKSEIAPNGTQRAKSTMSPKNARVRGEIQKRLQLTGLVILVHRIYSDLTVDSTAVNQSLSSDLSSVLTQCGVRVFSRPIEWGVQ